MIIIKKSKTDYSSKNKLHFIHNPFSTYTAYRNSDTKKIYIDYKNMFKQYNNAKKHSKIKTNKSYKFIREYTMTKDEIINQCISHEIIHDILDNLFDELTSTLFDQITIICWDKGFDLNAPNSLFYDSSDKSNSDKMSKRQTSTKTINSRKNKYNNKVKNDNKK